MSERILLKEIRSDDIENSPYGPERVRRLKRLERVGNYLEVHVWRNHVLVHASQDGHQERIREYCERHGVQW